MPFPPIDKSFEGVLRELTARLGLIERRLSRGGESRLGPEGAELTDWNSAHRPGFYWSENALNQPLGTALQAGIVTLNAQSGNVRQQVWRIYVDGSVPDLRVWERNFVSGVWQPWVQTSNGQDATDSGWITPTFVNGFSGASTAYRKKNGIVYLKGEPLNATAPVTSTQAFVLPVGFRPVQRVRTVNWASSGDPTQAVFLTVQSNGSVDILCSIARTSTPGYTITTSFPSD